MAFVLCVKMFHKSYFASIWRIYNIHRVSCNFCKESFVISIRRNGGGGFLFPSRLPFLNCKFFPFICAKVYLQLIYVCCCFSDKNIFTRFLDFKESYIFMKAFYLKKKRKNIFWK